MTKIEKNRNPRLYSILVIFPLFSGSVVPKVEYKRGCTVVSNKELLDWQGYPGSGGLSGTKLWSH